MEEIRLKLNKNESSLVEGQDVKSKNTLIER